MGFLAIAVWVLGMQLSHSPDDLLGALPGTYFAWASTETGMPLHVRLGVVDHFVDDIVHVEFPGGVTVARSDLMKHEVRLNSGVERLTLSLNVKLEPKNDLEFRALQVTYRDGFTERSSIGHGRLLAIPGHDGPLENGVYWSASVVGLLLGGYVVNRGDTVVTLQRMIYAPASRSTDWVWVRKGREAAWPRWRDELRSALPLRFEAKLEDYAVGVLEPPRGAAWRRASELNLMLAPGEAAFFALTLGSFRLDDVEMPVVSYPVVAYEEAGEKHYLGMSEPAVNMYAPWRQR